MVVAAARVAFGTTLRAIGRGFGSGIFGFSGAGAAKVDQPSARVRLVARMVDSTVDKPVDRRRGAR